jgi:hypothetical protein
MRLPSLERGLSAEGLTGGVLSKREKSSSGEFEFPEYSLAYAPPGLMKQLKPSASKDNLSINLASHLR